MTAYVNITKCFGENVKNCVNKFNNSFCVSNGSIRLKPSDNERSYITTHLIDLEELFPGNKFIRDKEWVIYLQLCFIFKLVRWACYESFISYYYTKDLVAILFFCRRRFADAFVRFLAISLFNSNICLNFYDPLIALKLPIINCSKSASLC